MKNDSIILERKGKVAIVTINRPQKRNAFDEGLFLQLKSITSEITSSLPRAVIITGAGDKSFSAGFDVHPENPMVKRIIDAAAAHDLDPAQSLINAIRESVDAFVSLPVPLIAAINGLAYGGGAELATRCDMRVMDPDAVICFSETKLGLMPDWGGGAALTRLIGHSRAADLILTGRKVSADEACSLGLVNKISAKGNALNESVAIAEKIAQNGPRAIKSSLSLIRQSANTTSSELLKQEALLAAELISSGECFYGVGAFLEKRDPSFPDIE
ncbi:MAG: enoyl-CoA hydratase/isomerase family protein [Deltaproteobacteria bacterium]|nr:enoyl-CoA hydratase/isomerase family protein [Deltaproteobacteria bacterium]